MVLERRFEPLCTLLTIYLNAEYGAGGLKPGPRKQFIILSSIISFVQGEEELVQCSTVINRFSPLAGGVRWHHTTHHTTKQRAKLRDTN